MLTLTAHSYKRFVVLTTLLLLWGCADSTPVSSLNPTLDANTDSQPQLSSDASYIIGGKNVSYKSHLAQSVVFISTVNNQTGTSEICTGSFITDQFIITASHCIPENLDNLIVSFRDKTYNKTLDIHTIEVANAFKLKHPSPEVSRHDLALIQYKNGLPKGAKTLELYRVPEKIKEKISNASSYEISFVSIGYGRTTGKEDVFQSGEGILRRVELKTRSNLVNDDLLIVDQDHLNKGVCFGDSGGPAIVKNPKTRKYAVLAVASYITPKDLTNRKAEACLELSAFLNVSFYYDVIMKTISENEFE